MFLLGLCGGLFWGGLIGAGWGVSAAMLLYFAYFFWALAHWQDFPYESDLDSDSDLDDNHASLA